MDLWVEWKQDPDFAEPERIASKVLREHLDPEYGRVDRSVRRGRAVGQPWERYYELLAKFPEKGNKKLIDALRTRGWDVIIRQKERTDSDRTYAKNQYSGYVMLVTMRLTVKIIKEQEDSQ